MSDATERRRAMALEAANHKTALVAAVTAGKALKAGAQIHNVRLGNPAAAEEGIVVHFDDAESIAVSGFILALLSKRLAV